VGLGEVLDRLADRDAGVQPGALKHDPDPLLELAVAPLGVVAEHPDLASAAAPVALQDLDRCGLSGPVWTEQPVDLAGLHGEREALHGLDRAVALAEVGDLDGGHPASLAGVCRRF